MDEAQIISDLIGYIYDAALDHALWPLVLEKACGFLNGQSAMFITRKQTLFEWGNDPHFLESYVQTYAPLNPFEVPLMVHGKVGDVRLASEYVSQDEFKPSRFYKEWMAPQGIIDAILVLFDKSTARYTGMAFLLKEQDGQMENESKRRARLLYPHFRRAVAIGQIIDLHKFDAAAFADSLDGLAAATFLVDAGGRLIHVNTAGLAMLEKGDLIWASAGKFAAADPEGAAVLRDIFANAENGDLAVSTKGIDVPLADRDGARYVAHVLPLTSGARRMAGTTYSAVAAVFVRKAELELPHPLEAIAAVFKLTLAEMRVLMTVVQMGGVREGAPVLGISEATMRTHLQHIFEKTDTNRQADLVKLVAGYMGPLG